MRGLAQDAARRVASSIGTLQEVEGELHLQLDEMAPGMRLPPTAYHVTRSLALDAELHPGFGLVAGQRVLVQWVGATPLIVDVLAAPGTTETLRFTPTSPAGGALTGDYPNPGLAPDSVATAHIQAGAVTGSGSGAMLFATGGPAIAPGAIGGADIADNAITTPKLANGAVTAAKQAIAVGGVLAGTLPNPTHATTTHTFPGRIRSDYTPPPFGAGSYADRHFEAISQDGNAVVGYSFHQPGSAVLLYKAATVNQLRVKGHSGEDYPLDPRVQPAVLANAEGVSTWASSAGGWNEITITNQTVTCSGSPILILYQVTLNNTGSATSIYTGTHVDGAMGAHTGFISPCVVGTWYSFSGTRWQQPAAGSHRIGVSTYIPAGTVNLFNGGYWVVTILEFQRA